MGDDLSQTVSNIGVFYDLPAATGIVNLTFPQISQYSVLVSQSSDVHQEVLWPTVLATNITVTNPSCYGECIRKLNTEFPIIIPLNFPNSYEVKFIFLIMA